jgi:hypothetical protein
MASGNLVAPKAADHCPEASAIDDSQQQRQVVDAELIASVVAAMMVSILCRWVHLPSSSCVA